MRLLILTQKIDVEDPILGFFHKWVNEFSKKYESIVVICLEKGKYNLPDNVKVISLGKEKGVSRLTYVLNFYKRILKTKDEYDSVFVHMNQEYALLGGPVWKLLGKKVFMWRNHPMGNFLTDISVFFCRKTFSTSKYSYTTKYKKNVIMPVGIDTEIFSTDTDVRKEKNSILFIGRIAPIKKPDLLLDALEILKEEGVDFIASLYGDSNQKDTHFHAKLKERVEDGILNDSVKFFNSVKNTETPEIYSRHTVSVNLTPSGSYDKTIFEAIACGTPTIASNKNLEGLIPDTFVFEEENPEDLAKSLKRVLSMQDEEYHRMAKELRSMVVENHSLTLLYSRLFEEIQ